MEILSPINSVSEVGPMHEAGATELYCGIMRREVQREFTNVFSFNSRQISEANLPEISELAEVVSEARVRGMKVFVTYNALYIEDQFEALKSEIEKVIACKPDGLIVADIALMIYLKERYPDVKIVVSTLGGTFNSRTALMYRGLGAARIIFPRHLTVGEIADIAAACPELEYEAFIMSDRCYFPNALCKFEHAACRVKEGPLSIFMSLSQRLLGRRTGMFTATYRNRVIELIQDRFIANNGVMCSREYEADLMDPDGGVLKSGLSFRLFDTWNSFRDACGLCALYDIAGVPSVRSVKIVGRDSLTSRKVADTRIVRDALELLKSKPSREAFTDAVKKIRKKSYTDHCSEAFCYYCEPDKKTSESK